MEVAAQPDVNLLKRRYEMLDRLGGTPPIVSPVGLRAVKCYVSKPDTWLATGPEVASNR